MICPRSRRICPFEGIITSPQSPPYRGDGDGKGRAGRFWLSRAYTRRIFIKNILNMDKVLFGRASQIDARIAQVREDQKRAEVAAEKLKKLDPNTSVVAVVQYMEGEKVQVTHVSITASILAEALVKDRQRTDEEIAKLEAEFARI